MAAQIGINGFGRSDDRVDPTPDRPALPYDPDPPVTRDGSG